MAGGPIWRALDAEPGPAGGARAGRRTPPVDIEGDAQLAGDVNWLMQNLRWDVAADLERLFPPRWRTSCAAAGRHWPLACAACKAAVAGRGRCAKAGWPWTRSRALMRTFRLIFIVFTSCASAWTRWRCRASASAGCALLVRLATLGRRLDAPRGERLRLALERLGPIFVKFGQVLSTRRDLLPLDVADELARLQDRVPPFPARRRGAGREGLRPAASTRSSTQFDAEPVASASIAQVHFARSRTAARWPSRCCAPGMLR
jgi:hypothetical protein